MAEKVNIEVARETWSELNARKGPGDSFDDVVSRTLDRHDELEELVEERDRADQDDVGEHFREDVAALEAEDAEAIGLEPDVDDEKTLVSCKHCGYGWDYGGSMDQATCPSCKGTTPVDT